MREWSYAQQFLTSALDLDEWSAINNGYLLSGVYCRLVVNSVILNLHSRSAPMISNAEIVEMKISHLQLQFPHTTTLPWYNIYSRSWFHRIHMLSEIEACFR
jgi:hypothetical protein